MAFLQLIALTADDFDTVNSVGGTIIILVDSDQAFKLPDTIAYEVGRWVMVFLPTKMN